MAMPLRKCESYLTDADGEERGSRKHRKVLVPDESSGHLDPENFARNYQLEALEKALRENTIAFLETGSGKTLIAVMLLRAYAHLLRKPSDSIAVFLVPTVVLVQQQAEVIEMHTDLKVGKYWGELGVDFWDCETWKMELKTHEVFVMTPQILLDNLRHCFFKLESIMLLIFDECHHARGRHPYACIMKEFYHRALLSNSSKLPRVFGMTASPIKGSVSTYGKCIKELETVLNSKIYTVQNEAVLAEFISFANPKVKMYKDIGIPKDLYSCLTNRLSLLKIVNLQTLRESQLNDDYKEIAERKITKLFDTYMFCLTELGVWCALKASESLSSVQNNNFFWAEMSNVFTKRSGIVDMVVRNFSQDVFKELSQHIPSEWSVGEDRREDIDAGFLTAKVDCLIQSLLEYRMLRELRCLIFVERVISAIVLESLLNQVPKLSCWKSKFMAGKSSRLHNQTLRCQRDIVDSFHDGSVNIIVATQILEEGLDVQSCNLVVRFDPSLTICSFIQSRGRARVKNSDYLLLIRSGDYSTLSKMNSYLESGDIMRKESIKQASDPCLPLTSEMSNDFYIVETTGAIVTLNSSIALLYFYCSRLPSDQYFRPFPRFFIDKVARRCTIHMPKSSPIQTITVQGSISLLKQIACLEACKKLHEIGAITDYLVPDFRDEDDVDAFRCGNFLFEPEQVDYFPGELVDSWSTFMNKEFYHGYSFSFKRNSNCSVAFSDIVLIVKCDLGNDFSDICFPLAGYISVGMEYVGVIHLDNDQVTIARKFQLVILRMLIDHNMSTLKDILDSLQQDDTNLGAAYLVLPLIGHNHNPPMIDWDCIRSFSFSSSDCAKVLAINSGTRSCCSLQCIPMVHTKNALACRCILESSLVFTPHNWETYFVTGFFEDLNGNSLMKMKRGEACTYKEYYKHKYGITLRHEKETLICGKHLSLTQNFLQKTLSLQEKESSNFVELPPELCIIILSNLTNDILLSFSLVPSIMHRVESMLLASTLMLNQLNQHMQFITVPTSKVLEAITTKKCQEEFSLESLETLGDSFLKYAASQELFKSNASHHEGVLSSKREKMICNSNLCKLGCKQKLPGYIRNKVFDPKMWMVPGDKATPFLEKDQCFTNQKIIYIKGTKVMKHKVVADVVEALIGAYLSTCGELAALSLMKWLGFEIKFVSDVPKNMPFQETNIFVNIPSLESLLQYKFHDPSLLLEALTHASYQLPDVPKCYQRLEFLGDAVLDYLITVHLYDHYPGLSPGLLTDLRSASVNNDCYAQAAAKAGLYKHILHASSELHRQISLFVNSPSQQYSRPTFGWEAGTHIPKVLGDIIESIAGAILVDSGFNKTAVWNSIRPLLEPLVTPDTIKYHPIKELEEICRKNAYENNFIPSSHNGAVSVTAEVIVNGIHYSETKTDANKKAAKKLAAKAILEKLKAMSSIPGF